MGFAEVVEKNVAILTLNTNRVGDVVVGTIYDLNGSASPVLKSEPA